MSLQKRVLDNDLWIDRQRLAWATAIKQKNFHDKFHFKPKKKDLAEVCREYQRQLFKLAYSQAFTWMLNTFERSLSKIDNEYDWGTVEHRQVVEEFCSHWPGRTNAGFDDFDAQEEFDRLIESVTNEIADKRQQEFMPPLKDMFAASPEALENYENQVRQWRKTFMAEIQGVQFFEETRRRMYPHFTYGAPDPELTNPVEQTVDLILKNAEVMNRGMFDGTELGPDQNVADIRRGQYLANFENYLLWGIATELVIGDTNLMLLQSSIMRDIIESKQGEVITCNDMEHLPFNKFYIEFDKPVRIVDLFEAVAMGIYAHHNKQSYTIVYYSDEPGGIYAACEEVSEGDTMTGDPEHRSRKKTLLNLHLDQCGYRKVMAGKPPINAPPYKEALLVHMCRGGEFLVSDGQSSGEYVGSEIPAYYETIVDGVYTTNGKEGVIVTEELLRITRNVWDFITCRNIDYEARRRPALKPNQRRYKHLQGKEAALQRDYRLIKVDRRVTPYESGAGPQSTLAHQIKVPGHFRKLIYCKSCGDLHRHDLIGQPCRDCELVVGPIANINVVKTWVSPHWKGPEDGPVQEIVREFQ